MFWKKQKGSITIFYSIILTSLMIGMMILVTHYSKEQKRVERIRMTQMASERTIANYSSHLFETYGLLAYYDDKDLTFPEGYLEHHVIRSLDDDFYRQAYAIGRNNVPLSIAQTVLKQLEPVKKITDTVNGWIGKVKSFFERKEVNELLELEKCVDSEYIEKGMDYLTSLTDLISPDAEPIWDVDLNGVEMSEDLSYGLSCIADQDDRSNVEKILDNISLISDGKARKHIDEGVKTLNGVKDKGLEMLDFGAEVIGINRVFFHEFILGTCELGVEDPHRFHIFEHSNKVPHLAEVATFGASKTGGEIAIYGLMYALRVALNAVSTYFDPVQMAAIKAGTTVANVVTFVPSVVYDFGVVLAKAATEATIDMSKLMKGEAVKFISIGKKIPLTEKIKGYYSDHLRLLLWLCPKSILIATMKAQVAKSLGSIYGKKVTLKDFVTAHKLINTKDNYEFVNEY